MGARGTPKVNNLANARLLTNNPNFTNPLNGTNAANPFRLDRTQAATADQNHGYTAEQQAYDGGKADLFPLYTGTGTAGGVGAFGTKGQVMGYYDGNTVDRALELRAALRDERQRLHRYVRTVDARRARGGFGSDQRRGARRDERERLLHSGRRRRPQPDQRCRSGL